MFVGSNLLHSSVSFSEISSMLPSDGEDDDVAEDVPLSTV